MSQPYGNERITQKQATPVFSRGAAGRWLRGGNEAFFRFSTNLNHTRSNRMLAIVLSAGS
jgi:hypothetical protein